MIDDEDEAFVCLRSVCSCFGDFEILVYGIEISLAPIIQRALLYSPIGLWKRRLDEVLYENAANHFSV